MRIRTLAVSSGILGLSLGLGAACGGAGGEAAPDAEVAEVAEAPAAENPRYGLWKMRTDAAPPAVNMMTYEPYGDGGMRIIVENTNGEGEVTAWSYTTMFDGAFQAVDGRDGTETAVEVVDEFTNRITSHRDGEVTQVIINVLSADGNSIDNEYRSPQPDGTERVSHAVYERVR